MELLERKEVSARQAASALHLIGTEVWCAVTAARSDELTKFAEILRERPRVFVLGEGRSGLVAKMFAMRLMHLGLQSWVVGETTSPSIAAKDVLVVVSGSGSGACLRALAESAKGIGAVVLSVTATDRSPMSAIANATLLIPAAVKTDQSGAVSQQFAGSLFEQTSLLVLDALFFILAGLFNQSAVELYQRHTNLE